VSWREIRAKWEADPTFRDAFDEEYPYAGVASAVARLRADNELTQEGLAKLVGTTQSVIARLEGGRHAVSVALLSRIAKALGQEWEPVFRPAAGAVADVSAANEANAALAAAAVTRSYLLDENTFVFHWSPEDFKQFRPQPDFVYIHDWEIVEVFGDPEQAHHLPYEGPASPWSTLFSNQPMDASRNRQAALARH